MTTNRHPWPSYNLHRLIDDVVALLKERGVTPTLASDKAAEREQGAEQLLSALCVTPTLSPEVSLELDGCARYNTRVEGG